MLALCGKIEQPWAWLIWLALVPWLTVLERERGSVAAIWSGAAMATVFVLVVFPWFATAIAEYTGLPTPIAFVLLALCGPGLQPQFVAFALVRQTLAASGRGRVLTATGAACAWVGTEWLCPRLFGDTLGHALFPLATLRQAADLAGAGGLTLVILLVNQSLAAALADATRSRRRATAALAASVLLVAALGVYGSQRLRALSHATSQRAPLTAALVQANLVDYEGLRARHGTYRSVEMILDEHEQLSRRALAADDSTAPIELLVWPETVYPTTFGSPKSPAGAELDARIAGFAAAAQVPLLFGTYDREGEREFNAAVLLQADAAGGTRADVYRKRRLFPLTERAPAPFDSPSARRMLPWLGTWHAGDGPDVLRLDTAGKDALNIAPLICLDAVDPSLAIEAARFGADVIVTLSNDGWFAATRGARLHLVVSAFRSIETRLPQLRATNTGISAVITPTGEILAHTPVGEPAVLTGVVQPVRHARTLAVRWGQWLGPVAALLGAILWLASLRVRLAAPA